MDETDGNARPGASDLPETVAPGSVVLVTGPGAPADDGRCLRVLHRYAAAGDAAVVVTTEAGAEATIADDATVAGEAPAATLGVVDTVTHGQNITAFHRAVPTIYTPGPADLARVAVAVDNLDAQLASPGVSHLVVRSVTSFFAGDDPDTLVPRIGRLFGAWPDAGIAVLGVDVTAVDEPTVAALQDVADVGVRVAVTPSGDRRLEHGGLSPS